VLDVLVQGRRDKVAVKTYFRKLRKGLRYIPRVIVTDQLGSYGAAKREVLSTVAHRQYRYLNNQAENFHEPTRQRERIMRRFKSAGHAQRSPSAHGTIPSHVRPRRHRVKDRDCRQAMAYRRHIWREITATKTAA
jgi:putative transposase